MHFLPTFEIERLAQALVTGARLELDLTPKPGLVDRLDRGSHPDLSFALMEESIGMVSVRSKAQGDIGRMKLGEFVERIKEETEKKVR